jgi:hypothetical protein
MKINAYLLEREYCASAEHVTEEILEAFLALMLRLAHLGGLSWEEAALVDRTAAHFGCEQRIVAAAAAKAGDKSLRLDDLVGAIPDLDLRACAYRDAFKVALADGVISKEEEAFLAEVSALMGLREEHTLALREIAQADLANQRRLGRLLVELAD